MRYILTLVATFFVVTLNAQIDNSLTNLGEGRETARMYMLPYSTADEALEAAGEIRKSKYVRPMEQWTMEQSDEATLHKAQFAYPFSWINRLVFVHVGAVGGAYDLYVNDEYVGSSANGFLPAEFNVTKYVREDMNSVTISVPRQHWSQTLECFDGKKEVAPIEVYAFSQPVIRVRDVVHSARIDATGKMANVDVSLVVKTESLNEKRARIHYELVAADTVVVEYGYRDMSVGMRGEDTVKFMARVPVSALWSEQSPTRLKLNFKTQVEGRYAEYYSLPTTFRELSYKQGQISINGKGVELRFGDVDPTTATAATLQELKRQGSNAVRVGEGVVPRSFYRLCESEGVYVVVCVPINSSASGESRKVGGNPTNDPAWREAYLDRAMATYRSTCDFGCVVGYELAAESANGINLYESYMLLKSLETKRPISYSDGGDEWNNDAVK